MSRARLQGRTGEVVHHGRALLQGYVHCFDHKGRDGTAKGNIALASEGQVHGVLYGLSDQQVELLAPFESGYEIILVDLELGCAGTSLNAYTYISEVSSPGLWPLESYVEHYMRGMLENDFPKEYVQSIRRQASP